MVYICNVVDWEVYLFYVCNSQ